MSTGLTLNYFLPYPLSTDAVNVAGDMEDLATEIDLFFTNPVFINDVKINGGDITTDATTASVFNATATTLNIGAAATAINIGSSSGQTDFRGNLNIATGKQYEINNVSVLTATTLGSSVVNSSLTSVGTIATGTWNATTIAVNKGGTGLTSYTTGDIVYASGSTTLAKLAGVATGNALLSGGVGTAPSWGKIGLTTHVSGTLPVANGGTGVTSSTGTGNVVLSVSPTFTGNVVLPSTTSIGNVSSTELGYLDGVTSAIQTQLNAKSPLASPTFTGVPAAPTASSGTNTTQIATTAFVQAAVASVPNSLPSQTGNSGKYLTTNGTGASWGAAASTSATANTLALRDASGNLSVVSPTSAESKGVREITMSTSSPSGGADGDVWLVYS